MSSINDARRRLRRDASLVTAGAAGTLLLFAVRDGQAVSAICALLSLLVAIYLITTARTPRHPPG